MILPVDWFNRATRAVRYAALIVAPAVALSASAAIADDQHGQVSSGGVPVSFPTVHLYEAGSWKYGQAKLLGTTKADAAGKFTIHYAPPSNPDAQLYLVAAGGAFNNVRVTSPFGPLRLAAVLGSKHPANAVINERTTVALAYAFAQFIHKTNIAGPYPGPKNAALTAHNLANVATGDIAHVLATEPNGDETQTMGEFNSLANLLAACVRGPGKQPCNKLFALATPPGGHAPKNTLEAALNIARNPANNAEKLFKLSNLQNAYTPVLDDAPDTWTIALLYVGNGRELDGPGNIAFDADGNAWIANNYVFKESPEDIACGGKKLIRLDPAGNDVPGAPYGGGGLYGAGYGIARDHGGNIWVGNFGFQGSGCTEKQRDKSVSKFSPHGEALSPDVVGYGQGDINRPQGLDVAPNGDLWIANCGGDSLTVYRGADHKMAENFANLGLDKPFDVGVAPDGYVWATSNGNNRVIKISPDGKVVKVLRRRDGIRYPMGIAVDSLGNAWVAVSGIVSAPCHKGENFYDIPRVKNAAIVMVKPDGTVAKTITGGGVHIPFGISVDGDDNVWAVSFGRQRITQICGARPKTCPAGVTTGEPISPSTGFTFDGFTRNTAAQVDPSGNVWVTNNWLNLPIQTNPGGKEMAVLVGLGAPTPVKDPSPPPASGE
jgi:sugar lactone lactonase YvrE